MNRPVRSCCGVWRYCSRGFAFWRVRDVQRLPTLKAMFQAFAVAMAGLAMVGAGKFLRDEVGVGIALEINVEVFFELAFLSPAKKESLRIKSRKSKTSDLSETEVFFALAHGLRLTLNPAPRTGGRVVEGARLESV